MTHREYAPIPSSSNDDRSGSLHQGVGRHDRVALETNDGIDLSVLIITPPPGADRPHLPPILAVHGFGASAHLGWQRSGHLDALAAAGRHVIAPDLRGHGASAKPHDREAYRLPLILQDLVAASSLAGAPGQFDLLGYSLGARLCWTIVERNLLPVRRCVVGGFDGRPAFSGVSPQRVRELISLMPDNDPTALEACASALAGQGRSDADRRPDTPTLAVAGDRDPIAAGARRFAAGLTRCTFVSAGDRSHASTVTSPSFHRATVAFLAEETQA